VVLAPELLLELLLLEPLLLAPEVSLAPLLAPEV